MNLLHRELMRQAVEAAREGDRATAISHLKEVLEGDPKNARAWLLLARLTGDREEKRMALATVLSLEPDNEKAQELMAQLEARSASQAEEVLPGISRRALNRAAGCIGGMVVLLILVLVVISLINKNRDESEQRRVEQEQATQARLVARMTEDYNARQTEVAGATETEQARFSPTPTIRPTSAAPTLPPTLTPSPTPTEPGLPALPPPSGITGIISGWSGNDMLNVDVLPPVLYNLTGEASYVVPVPVSDNTGQMGYISPDNNQMVYAQFIRRHNNFEVTLIDLYGRELPSNLDQAPNLGRFAASYMPAFSADGNMVVFIADALDTQTAEVYLVNLYDVAETTPLRLTSDTANYSYPAFSPDGSRVVAVRENPASQENPGPDLVIIDVGSRTLSALTTDNAAVFETMPRWTPDGELVAYAATAGGPEAEDHNLYMIAVDNPGTGFLAIDDPANAIFPVFSPDGQYLAFSSNRNGHYDIFIFNLLSRDLFQLTNTREEDYPTNWIALSEP